jgi:hypothetical protein
MEISALVWFQLAGVCIALGPEDCRASNSFDSESPNKRARISQDTNGAKRMRMVAFMSGGPGPMGPHGRDSDPN